MRRRGPFVVVLAWGAGAGLAACGGCDDDRPPAASDDSGVDGVALVDGAVDADAGDGSSYVFVPGPAVDASTMLALCGASGSDLASPWGGPGGCPTRVARTRYRGPRRAEMSVVTPNQAGLRLTAVTENNVAFGGGESALEAIDLTTGAPVSVSTARFGGDCWLLPGRAACIDGCGTDNRGHVVFFAPSGAVTGGATVTPSCAIGPMNVGTDGELYVTGSSFASVTGVLPDGGLRIVQDGGSCGVPTPSRAGDVLYAPCGASATTASLVAFDTATGAERWRLDIRITTAPMVAPDDRIYVGVALDDGGGAVRGYEPDGGPSFDVPLETPIVVTSSGSFQTYVNGLALGASPEGDASTYSVLAGTRVITAIRADGTVAWTHAVDGGVGMAVVDADGWIFGAGAALRPDGKVGWSAVLPPGLETIASIVIGADGAIYATTNLGLLRFAQ